MIYRDEKVRKSIQVNSIAVCSRSVIDDRQLSIVLHTSLSAQAASLETLLRGWVLTNCSRGCRGNEKMASTHSRRFIRLKCTMPTDKRQVLPFRSKSKIEPMLVASLPMPQWAWC